MISYDNAILIALAAAFVSALISGTYYARKIHRKVSYTLDALEDKETNFRFNEKKLFHRNINRTLNRIRQIFENERAEIMEQERLYGQMLDQVKTGIVVIDLSKKLKGRVVYSNNAALNMLGIATFSNIRQLKNISPELEECFQNITRGKGEMRLSLYNEKGQTTLSATASETKLQGTDVKIVALNDITGDMAHNEELSWNKLIRVLTHEIMNTITPIASLSRMLSDEIDNASDEEPLNRKDLKLGLDTIADSSKGLIRFVETYRSLTRVSAPVKKAFYVRELIERVTQLTRKQLLSNNVELDYIEKSDDILLYADEDQIAQVMVNLIKNAVQAEAQIINITAEIDFAENVVINVANNGKPINKENKEEIFVPFYTTKQDGTGIGLSLSRQIMRLHNGTIALARSDDEWTKFTLQFK